MKFGASQTFNFNQVLAGKQEKKYKKRIPMLRSSLGLHQMKTKNCRFETLILSNFSAKRDICAQGSHAVIGFIKVFVTRRESSDAQNA